MRRMAISLLLTGLMIAVIAGCSNENNSSDATVGITANETEKIDDNKEATRNIKDDSEIEVDKSAILDAYDRAKADLGKYYYVWDSPKFEIPLLLITDYCVTGEDAEIFGLGAAYDCKVYFADPNKELMMVEIGDMEADSTSYPLAGSDDGLFAANDHYVYQFIPDYNADKLVLWYGFEDDIVNILKEHTGFLKIKDGEVEDVENVETAQAYDAYYSAEVFSFERTSETAAPFELFNLSKEYEIESLIYEYAVNLTENGKYCNFEGDIGDVLGEYKDIDIDGDGKTDTIERVAKENGEYAYLFSFSNGNKLQSNAFTALPNEGEIIELKDMDGDCKDEILVTHYTDGTGGPEAWNVYLYYYNYEEGKWDSIVIKDEFIQMQEIASECGFTIGSYEEPKLVSVELTEDGLAMLIDYDMKNGAGQTFDLDVFLFGYDKGDFALIKHSPELVSSYWSKNTRGY